MSEDKRRTVPMCVYGRYLRSLYASIWKNRLHFLKHKRRKALSIYVN
jgi:hypothetical protein